MNLYRITATRTGKAPFVDWYEAESKDLAMLQWERDALEQGVLERNTAWPVGMAVEAIQCDPTTLKPIQS